MIKRTVGAIALFVAAAGMPAAADTIGDEISQWEVGAICPSTFDAAGRNPGNLPFVARTQVVPAAVGMGFGVKVQTSRPGGISGVTLTVTSPPGGPGTQSFRTSLTDTGLSNFYYRFENASEAAPGTWTITASSDGVVLYSIDIQSVTPGPRDGLMAACGM